MTAGDKTSPEFRNVVVVESNEIAGNRTSGESGEHYSGWVATILLANPRHDLFVIINGRSRIIVGGIAPPSDGFFRLLFEPTNLFFFDKL